MTKNGKKRSYSVKIERDQACPLELREFKITVRDEEFTPIICRDLMWHRDHIVRSGPDYSNDAKHCKDLIKAFNKVIEYYGG